MTETTSQIERPETTYYSGILYHGAGKPFQFDIKFDYDHPTSDGSETLGPGLYLTLDRHHAENFSRFRQGIREGSNQETNIQLYTYSVYVNDCKFLDFRDSKGGNTPVTRETVNKWFNFFQKKLDDEKKQKPDVGPRFKKTTNEDGITMKTPNPDFSKRHRKEEYLDYLNKLKTKNKIDLRKMLNTQYSGWVPYGDWWREFVIKELGYDGVIYIEGTDYDKVDTPTFVVYDLESIKISEKPVE